MTTMWRTIYCRKCLYLSPDNSTGSQKSHPVHQTLPRYFYRRSLLRLYCNLKSGSCFCSPPLYPSVSLVLTQQAWSSQAVSHLPWQSHGNHYTRMLARRSQALPDMFSYVSFGVWLRYPIISKMIHWSGLELSTP